MDIELKLKLSELEMKFWIGYAVLHGWKRPRNWSNWERRNAIMYGIKTRLRDVSEITEVFAAEAIAEAAE
jgi:hypothetical protein